MPILLESDLRRPLPELIRVRQQFDDTHLPDDKVAAAVQNQMKKRSIQSQIRPGARVAVAVGSRGIRNLSTIVRTVVEELKAAGADPFIVSAMGSHGNGTEDGQRAILAGYGITEQSMRVPLVTAADTVCLGEMESGQPVWFDRAAYHADMVVPINRIKLHTDFIGPLQSGLCKMLVIGLGNQKGCSAIHETAPEDFAAVIEKTASFILKNIYVGFGVAILENAYDKTYMIEAIPSVSLIQREKELVRVALEHMPYLMFSEADVIICEEVGKDISGTGFDPNILGRSSLRSKFLTPIPKYQKLILCNLSENSHGNAGAIGLADVVTRQLVSRLDLEAMYANGIACNALVESSIPCTVDSEETAVRVALKCCRGIDRANPRIIRLKNTLTMEYIEVSPALLPDVQMNPRLSIVET